MNTFAHIKPIAQYDKVSYYSICIGDNPISLFEEFMGYHTVANKEKLNHVLEWIKIIGNKYGAQTHLFRPEGETADASALPPKVVERKPQYAELGIKKANNIRLYCLRANESVVFLFNGDIKTAKKAQDCPNVKKHFKLANQLTKAIDSAFANKEILWNDDLTTTTCEDDFMLQF
ncbi:hypothetical protein H8R23_10320 [Flavobacterium sp. F-380]|uniref:Uncharacterized protein n=1 Tax=Flavobacterium kayseriense TaxID=2764714 RepID=A0ABR7J8B9_9FLAO|nr:hypothetical protein [Flavobacterium kayseriense]MBC5841800.1 hypothetical protein [Flavobacterium kayseriense]MBC5848329.1 hypothetical protein [Flavobacterium kayseriense]